MDIYCKSAVQGAVMLLNSTPDTTCLIPVSHANVYKALGDEIKRRFDHPVKTASGNGYELTISFNEPALINHVVIREEIAFGRRIHAYVMEGYTGTEWIKHTEGSSIGTMKIDPFPEKNFRKSDCG